MKLTALLLLIGCLHVSASVCSQTVTLSAKKLPLATLFAEIKKQTGFVFFLTNDLIKDVPPVSLEVKDMGLKNVLDLILKDALLDYEIEGKSIVVFRRKSSSATSDKIEMKLLQPITGRVVDSLGRPIQGASIRLKPGNKGTSTEADGSFTIADVRAGEYTLEVSLVGHQAVSRKVTVRESEPLVVGSVVLRVSTQAMEEVNVVYNTGFQLLDKTRTTGSFVQIDNELLNRSVSTNIIERLEHVTNGLLFDRYVNPNDKKPVFDLQIRGVTTLSDQIKQPLIVLDNFPYYGDINNINPNDIESITILRDATAASIWGAKSGNGVIVLTSKQGKLNKPFKVSVNSNVNIAGKPDLFKLPLLSSSENIDNEIFFFNKGYYNSNINSFFKAALSPIAEILVKLRAGQISEQQANEQIDVYRSYDVRNDFEKYVYRTSIDQQHNISLSGGSKELATNLSFGYAKKLNELVGNKGRRISINSNTTYQPIDKLQLQVGLSYTNSNNTTNSLGGFSTFNDYSPNGYLPLYSRFANDSGQHLPINYKYRSIFIDTVGGGNLLDWKLRPLDERYNRDFTAVSAAFTGSLRINYKILDWLSAEANYQYQKNISKANNYYSVKSFYARDLINLYTNLKETNAILRYPIPIGGILDASNSDLESYGIRGSLQINKNFNNRHVLSGIFGFNLDQKHNTSVFIKNFGYNKETIGSLPVNYNSTYPLTTGGLGILLLENNFDDKTDRFVSIFGNLGYTFEGRYNVNASFRRDASNLFGVETNNKWKPFWSTGIGWDISNENFYKFKAIPVLSLRATFGYQGNANNTRTAISVIEHRTTQNPLINIPYAVLNQTGNPNLKWENTKTINIGLDWALKNQCLSGSFEYYKKISTDVVYSSNVDFSTGLSVLATNSADMKVGGWDIMLQSKPINTKNFKWSSTLNLSKAESVVTKVHLNSSLNQNTLGSYSLTGLEGVSPYTLISYKWAGLDPLTGDPQGLLNGKISKNYDSLMYNSGPESKQIHGSRVPEIFGNFLSGIEVYGIGLNANIIYKFKYYLQKNSLTYSGLAQGNGNADYRNRWQAPGDERVTNIPSLIYPLNPSRDQFYSNSEITVFRGDHVRLNDISISYSINQRHKIKLPVKEINFYAIVGNLNIILWRKNKLGIDPAAPNGNISSKSYAFGLNVNF